MRHDGGDTLKSQDYHAGLRGLPLKAMECDNFCLPHASVGPPLPQPEPTNGTGSATQGRPCTPAMAAGLTDHVWTLREVLLFRVPPWPQPVGVGSSQGGGPGLARCVHTAHFEGVTRGEKATGMP